MSYLQLLIGNLPSKYMYKASRGADGSQKLQQRDTSESISAALEATYVKQTLAHGCRIYTRNSYVRGSTVACIQSPSNAHLPITFCLVGDNAPAQGTGLYSDYDG